MSDITAVKEAIEWFDNAEPVSPDGPFEVVFAAARKLLALTETGQRVEWCETHGSQVPYTVEGVCWRVLDHAEKLECSIIPTLVIPADYLTEEK